MSAQLYINMTAITLFQMKYIQTTTNDYIQEVFTLQILLFIA